jgi:hypothetical protein
LRSIGATGHAIKIGFKMLSSGQGLTEEFEPISVLRKSQDYGLPQPGSAL